MKGRFGILFLIALIACCCVFFLKNSPKKAACFSPSIHPLTTQLLKMELLKLFKGLEIKTLIDVPCGEIHWVKEMNPFVRKYIGVDKRDEIIEKNRENYGSMYLTFEQLDCTRDLLPKSDLIFCHDAFNDCTSNEILAALLLFKKSGAKYFLATMHTDTEKNSKGGKGGFTPINWQLKPYDFPKPLLTIHDPSCENKKYALWKMEDIQIP